VVSDLAKKAADALRDEIPEDVIRGALQDWSNKPEFGPGMLPALISSRIRAPKSADSWDPNAFDWDQHEAEHLEERLAEGKRITAEERAWLDNYRGRQ